MSTPAQIGRPKMRVIELRFLAPIVIVISFLADVGLRLVPPERIAFRAWEAVTLWPIADGPFTPSMVYHNDRSYGDLSNLGNLPSLRVYRTEHFTTDSFGFRNTPSADNRPVRIIVVGDSFAAGSGLSDSETLAAQLAEMSQNGVYNSGNDQSWRGVEELIKTRHLINRGLVVWEISERYDLPAQGEDGESFGIRILRSLLPKNLYSPFRTAQRYALYSPLKIVMTRIFREVQNDRWLPNVSADRLLQKRLSNGREMLFLHSEVANFGIMRPASPDFFVRVQTFIRATGNELLVLMIPDKYNVYHPLLMESPDPPGEESPTLGELARRLRTNGVPALDLTQVFRQQAAASLRNDQYLYWPDDTHWNPAGVKIAAQAIVNFLRESGLWQLNPETGAGHR